LETYSEIDGGFEYEDIEPSTVVYHVEPGQAYGPVWRMRRPPGLPAYARLASMRGAARLYIEQIARAQMLDEVFVTTIRHLADTESGGRFALPANKFDARSQANRPAGKRLITAWGAFQFNRDAWRSLPGVAQTVFPWDSTPYDEITRPIQKYAELYFNVLGAGGSDLDAARGVRLWHRTPAGYRQYLGGGQRQGFSTAWQRVSAQHRSAVDEHLRKAGVF
jgi:hypothetical protein